MKNSLVFEQNVLGSCLYDGSMIVQCQVRPADFELSTHRAMWDVILRLHGAKQATDALSVTEMLDQERAPPPPEGWLAYCRKLIKETASPAQAGSYANQLREYAAVRQAQAIGQALSEISMIDELDAKIRSLMELNKGTTDHSCHLLEAMQDAVDLLSGDEAAISTGLRDLDGCTGGMHDEDLIIVGARPAMGKTAFMLNLALSSSVPVGMISGEQGRGQIGMRVMSINGEVSLHKMRTNGLSNEDWDRITFAMSTIKNRPIWMNDKPAPSIDDVIRQARIWKHEHDIGLLMIDYLQKLRGGGGADMRLQIGDVVSRLKDLARELKIPVVVLAQVKREVESRGIGDDGMGRMPFASDMAESGIIEQEADQIYTLYRPEVYSDDPRFRGVAYVNICKNRHGPIGHKAVSWRGEFLKFGDLAQFERGF